MKTIYKQTTLACFSPPVMIATFVVEVICVLSIFLKRRTNKVTTLSIALILSLAAFQLAEFGICEDILFAPQLWAKLGFVAITVLPPLGLHIIYAIAKKHIDYVLWLSYALAVIWIVAFTFTHIMRSATCEGNYVIFHITDPAEQLYYLYYNGVIAISLLIAWKAYAAVHSRRAQVAITAWIAGYIAFIIPSAVVRIIFDHNDAADSTLPSIMCGFAVLLALILATTVLPRASKPRAEEKTKTTFE